MPALSFPLSFPLYPPSSGSFPSQHRSLEPRRPHGGGYYKPADISAGVLVVFCLVGASLALLVWWLFVRRSGFIWRKSDWEDYKSSVLRRPDQRPDDAITVFSDGTTRRGGSGSSVGARTVVLGELDTTYTKSEVVASMPWERRGRGGAKSFLGSVWGTGEGTIWGKLRGGERSQAGTIVAREKEMRTNRHDSTTTRSTFVDMQRPAPPLGVLSHTNLAQTSEKRSGGVTRETSYASYAHGDDLGVRYSRPGDKPSKHRDSTLRQSSRSRHQSSRQSTRQSSTWQPSSRHHSSRQSTSRHQPSSSRQHSTREPKSQRHHRPVPVASESESSSSESSSSEESSDDESELDQSQIGMAKGTKVYHHPLFAGRQGAVEKPGNGVAGSYGGSSSNLGRGYRAGSVGSLSSEGSVASSHAGR